MRVLICAGASGGHLNPALALAGELKRVLPEIEVSFVTTKRAGLEEEIKKRGYRVFFISVRGLSGGLINKFIAGCLLLFSFVEAFFAIEKSRPDIIVGFGSYVSFPVLLEGAFFKKKTLIHEQNVSLGRANKMLYPFVDKIALSFSGRAISQGNKFIYTGNPLRENLNLRSRREAVDFFGLEDKFTILIVGGSQGARGINREFKRISANLQEKADLQFIHITGSADFAGLKDYYQSFKINYKIFEFLPQMDFAYTLAGMVISRAGAATISELAYFKKPAILVPYPGAGGHQLENALALEKNDAARVIEEKDFGGDMFLNNIKDLISSPEKRNSLSENIAKFANSKAVENLAKAVCELCEK